MRSSDCDILVIPGDASTDEDHWQARWAKRLSTARRIVPPEPPDPEPWTARLVEGVRASTRPVILVAHGLGVAAVAHAAPHLPPGIVRGAFLVGPHDVEDPGAPGAERGLAPLPRDPLPFPSLVVASRDDPHCAYDRAEDCAYAWGAAIVDAGAAGHLDAASGHGPWPEGLMRFAGFLKTL